MKSLRKSLQARLPRLFALYGQLHLKVILADEPTENLDEDTAADITAILKECAQQMNKCVVIMTYSNELARKADVAFRLKKGQLKMRL